MRPLRVFWWSPGRDVRLGAREIRANPIAWAEMGRLTGRLMRNFGDELSPYALRQATGRDVVWAPPSRAQAIAIGSILEFYLWNSPVNGAAVWGSGMWLPPQLDMPASEFRSRLGPILAVRGPHTLEALDLPRSTPMGDPGILAASLVPRAAMRSGIGFLPHFRMWGSRKGRRELSRIRGEGVRIIPPGAHPLEVLRRISQLDFLYSSSLHGIIAGHAMGIPVQWVSIPSGGTKEPAFKFNDHASAVGVSISAVPSDEIVGTVTPTLSRLEAEVKPLRDACDRLAQGLVDASADLA